MVKEDQCRGRPEPKVQAVRACREDQGVDRYDEVNKEWRQIVLKNALAARPLENLVHAAWISFIFAAMT